MSVQCIQELYKGEITRVPKNDQPKFHELHEENTYSILLIDLEPDHARVIELALELTTKWHCSYAGSYFQGLKMAQNLKPELILINALGASYWPTQFFEQLQKNLCTRNIPLVFILDETYMVDNIPRANGAPIGILIEPFEYMNLFIFIEQFLAKTQMSA